MTPDPDKERLKWIEHLANNDDHHEKGTPSCNQPDTIDHWDR